MKHLLLVAALFASTSAHAGKIPAKLLKAAAQIKSEQVRTIIVKTPVETPCDGGYVIHVQVKQPIMNGPDAPTTYKWETVKTLGADANGETMEVCYE